MSRGKYECRQKEKHAVSHRPWIYISCVVGVLLVGILVAKVLPPKIYELKYNKAVSELGSKKYDKAEKIFNGLPYFESADTQFFLREYIDSLCNESCYSDAHEVLSGSGINHEAIRLVDDNTIRELDQLVSYNEAEFLLSQEDVIQAYQLFSQILDYEDSKNRADKILNDNKEYIYSEALEKFEEMTHSSVEKAKVLFEMIPDYERSKRYVDVIHFIEGMCGTYKKSGFLDTEATYVIDYCMVTRYEGDDKTVSTMHIVEAKNGDFYYVTDKPIPITQIFNRWEWRYDYQDEFNKWHCISDSTEAIRKPEIGMTAEEVEKSTWGSPEKINKSTYAWGTSEQWVYKDYRYIYLDNGIVKAIQE